MPVLARGPPAWGLSPHRSIHPPLCSLLSGWLLSILLPCQCPLQAEDASPLLSVAFAASFLGLPRLPTLCSPTRYQPQLQLPFPEHLSPRLCNFVPSFFSAGSALYCLVKSYCWLKNHLRSLASLTLAGRSSFSPGSIPSAQLIWSAAPFLPVLWTGLPGPAFSWQLAGSPGEGPCLMPPQCLAQGGAQQAPGWCWQEGGTSRPGRASSGAPSSPVTHGHPRGGSCS